MPRYKEISQLYAGNAPALYYLSRLMSGHTPGIIHEALLHNIIADSGIQSEVSLFYRLASLPVLRKRQ